MPTAKINDMTMYYEVHGEGEPLVFVCGFSVDHTAWTSIFDQCVKKYKVILLDNRGTGQSDVPEGPYSIDQMTSDVVALCAHLNIKKAHFVGSSMGGFIVQTLAHKYPDLVKSAVISNSVMRADTAFMFYLQGQLALMEANTPIETMVKVNCGWAFSFQFLSRPGMLDAFIQLALNRPCPFTPTAHRGQYAALSAFDSTKWAHEIRVPTLVVGADLDLIFSEASIKALADNIPRAKYHLFKNCGHIPHIEYPDEFVNLLLEFCR